MKLFSKFARAAAPLALVAAVPAFAQASDSAAAVPTAQMFAAQPLTSEQQTRLPAAEQVVARIFPPGTYKKMMDQSMKPMMDAVMGQVGAMPVADLVRMAGIPEVEVANLGEGTLAEMMAIIDPAYDERQKLVLDASMSWASQLMNRMEPSFRAGLARAYAVRFSEAELTELRAFFVTPTGAHYAEQSMLIMVDPQVMAAFGEMMPAMMEAMPQLMEDMRQKTESLPKPRKIEELTEAERARLAELLGVPAAELD
jgi:hypothetical protein